LCAIDLQRAYHGIVTRIWTMFKSDMIIAPTIQGPDDSRWEKMVDRYESLVKEAPKEVRDYCDSMMRVHVYELEAMWRWKDENSSKQTA